MKILICGSMAFAQDMLNSKKILEKMGHHVILPENTEDYTGGKLKKLASGWGTLEGAKRKIDNNLIRNYYNEIEKGDAVLIMNKDKNGIKNYISGNSFLEMGFAHVLGKKIYLFQGLPDKDDLPMYYQEIVAMQPDILNEDLLKIK